MTGTSTSSSVAISDERDDGAFIPSFLDDFGLSPFEFRLYSHIARRAGGQGQCWEGIDKMAKICRMERKTAYKAFQFLEDHRMVRVERKKGATSHITLTNRSSWIPPDQEVTSDRPTRPPHPLKGTSKKKISGCAENGIGTGCTLNGIPPVPQTGYLPIPETEHLPIPNMVHKGTPYEGTPIEGSPNKEKERADDFFAIAPSSQDQEDIFPVETTPRIQEAPTPPTPASPSAPEISPKRVYADPMGDRFANKGPSRKAITEPLTKDDDFLRYLFTRLKTKPYYKDLTDREDLEPIRVFIRKSWFLGAEGDARFAEMENYIKDYEKHKAAEVIATQQRSQPQQTEAEKPFVPISSERSKQLVAQFRASRQQKQAEQLGIAS